MDIIFRLRKLQIVGIDFKMNTITVVGGFVPFLFHRCSIPVGMDLCARAHFALQAVPTNLHQQVWNKYGTGMEQVWHRIPHQVSADVS